MKRETDILLAEAARRAILSLKPEEFIGTAEVGDVAWDVYVHALPPRTKPRKFDAVTVAVRLENGHAIVGCFAPGRLPLEQVTLHLHTARA